MTTRVNLADAKAKFSAVVDDVRHTANRYLVMRHGKPAAAIVSVEDLERLEGRSLPDSQPLGFLALLGAGGDITDEEIDEFIEDIYAARAADTGRPVDLE
jgi:prevent-host-death family protein